MKIYLVVLMMISSIATSCKQKTNGSLGKEYDDSSGAQDSETSGDVAQGDNEANQNSTGGGFSETGGSAGTTGASRREPPKCEASYQKYIKNGNVWSGDIVAIRCTVKVPADNEPPLCGDRSYRAEVDLGQKEVIEGVNPGEFKYMLNTPCRCTCIRDGLWWDN
jgi:hypothetical protein